jgi:hypothetical protein
MLHLALVLASWCLYAWIRHRRACTPLALAALGALVAMALCVHQLTLIVLAPLVLLVLIEQRWRVLWALPGGLLGLFAAAPGFLSMHAQGMNTLDIVRCFLTGKVSKGGASWESMILRVDHLGATPHLLASVLVSLVGCGAIGLLRRPTSRLAGAMWMAASLNLLFALTYEVPDRFTFFLPGAALAAVLGVQALVALGARVRSWVLPALITVPVLLSYALPLLIGPWLMTLPRVKVSAPGLNQLTYYFSPLIPDRSAWAFTQAMAVQAPPGSTVYADHITLYALRSAEMAGQFTGRRLLPCDGFVPGPVAEPVFLVQALSCGEPMRYVQATLPVGFRLDPARQPLPR